MADVGVDATAIDAATLDVGVIDAAIFDASAIDAAIFDAGAIDAMGADAIDATTFDATTGTDAWGDAGPFELGESCEATFGGAGRQVVTSVSTNGTIVAVGGFFFGTAEFPDGPRTSVGNDGFVALYDTSCHHLATRTFGVPSGLTDYVWDVAVDDAGDVFVVGRASAAIDLGTGIISHTAMWESFVARYDSSLTPVWARFLGTTARADMYAESQLVGLDVSATGEIVVTGSYRAVLAAGTPCELHDHGSTDSLVMKLDGDGTCVWARSWGAASASQSFTYDVALVGSRVVVTGFVTPRVGATLVGADAGSGVFLRGGYIVGLGPDGTTAWGRSGPELVALELTRVGEDVVFGALADGPVDLGGGSLGPVVGDRDLVAARLGAVDGAHVWSRRWDHDDAFEPAAVGALGSTPVLLARFAGDVVSEGLSRTGQGLATIALSPTGTTLVARDESVAGGVGALSDEDENVLVMAGSPVPAVGEEDVVIRILRRL